MKKNILLLILIQYSILLFSQELKENTTDEFTGARILRSSWETLCMPGWTGLVMYARASYIDGTTYLDTKIMYGTGSKYGKVFAVNEGEILMLKLTSGEIIKLYNPEHRVTSIGEGARGLSGSAAYGLKLHFKVSDEIILKFKLDPPTKVRLYSTDGYFEEKINAKEAKRLAGIFQIIGK